ncbi:MAG: lipopolysaccharide assembly protein LapA domain-containing protein [Acidimicrobiia bacterium]|nr:lipopolysaccharide assembly protein LapA domain-containing protein [Acidimicrobiia bacterium]
MDEEREPTDQQKPEPERPETPERSPRPEPAPPPVDAGVPWGLIFFLILSVLMAIFAVQNTQDVELGFLTWSGEFPLIMIIVGVFVTAVILDEILGTILRRRRRTRKMEKQELERLRKQR